MSDRKIDYGSLVSTAKSMPILNTAENVRQSLLKENPGIEFPQFSRFFISDKNAVPKGAQVIKDKFYMGKVYDLHFVKKDGIGNHVLYFVRK